MRQQGFTLIELVMVLVIIGILSAAGIGLFATRSDFAPFLAKDVLISSSLLAQQRALANQQATSVTLTVSQDADNWTVQVAQGGTSFDAHAVERAGTALSVDGSTLSNGSSVTLTYDRRGSTGSTGSTGSNRCFEFEGAASFDVCVSSEGFAYECSCP